MSIGFRRSAAAMTGLFLLVSLASASWQQLTSGTPAVLMSVHFPEGTKVGYAVGAEPAGGGVIVKTTDGGGTWVPQDPGTLGGLNSVYFKDNNNGFAVGQGGTVIGTTDGGAVWNPPSIPITDNLTGVQFPENGQIGYIFAQPRSGQQSKALKTTDGGDNWTAINVGTPPEATRGGRFANDSVGVIVGDDGLVLGTTDGLGTTGHQDARTNADLVAAAFSPADPNRGYLIGSDSIRGVIRYTDDGGATQWDSVRCWDVQRFYGVDMPTSDYAYVCGTDGKILLALTPRDFVGTRVPVSVTATMYGLCFPNGVDTGYAVGASGTILRTYDKGIPWWYWVAEEKEPAMSRTGIRVVYNPSRRGITLDANRAANVVVLDAAGRVVKTQAANKGRNFLPLSKAGVYFVGSASSVGRQASSVTKVVLTE